MPQIRGTQHRRCHCFESLAGLRQGHRTCCGSAEDRQGHRSTGEGEEAPHRRADCHRAEPESNGWYCRQVEGGTACFGWNSLLYWCVSLWGLASEVSHLEQQLESGLSCWCSFLACRPVCPH